MICTNASSSFSIPSRRRLHQNATSSSSTGLSTEGRNLGPQRTDCCSLRATLKERQKTHHVHLPLAHLLSRSRNALLPDGSVVVNFRFAESSRSGTGHKGHYRPLKPEDEVNEVISLKPSTCTKCGYSLSGDDETRQRHQVTDIPPVVAETIEYQLHLLECPRCGTKTRSQLPQEVSCSAFGPHLMAMVAALSGQYHLSKRHIEEILSDFFGADIGLGTVHALEQSMSEALKGPVALRSAMPSNSSHLPMSTRPLGKRETKRVGFGRRSLQLQRCFLLDSHVVQKLPRN